MGVVKYGRSVRFEVTGLRLGRSHSNIPMCIRNDLARVSLPPSEKDTASLCGSKKELERVISFR